MACSVAARARTTSQGSRSGSSPVVALCLAGSMAAPDVLDYLSREIALLWRGGASLVDTPPPVIRHGSDVLRGVRSSGRSKHGPGSSILVAGLPI